MAPQQVPYKDYSLFLHGGLHRVPCAGARSQGTAWPRRMVGGDSKPLLPPGGLGFGFRV